MNLSLEKFFLRLPASTLRKVSYAWFGVVVFYPWSPLIAAFLGASLLLSLLLLFAHNRAWEQLEIEEATTQKLDPYVDRPRMPWGIQIRNLALALIASGAVAYFLGGRLSLTGPQWFLIFIGFFLLQFDLRLFGAPVVYILSTRGLAIRYADIKVFLHYGEIRTVIYVTDIKKPAPNWNLLTPYPSIKEGLLLVPSNKDGFTRLLDQILLAPTDIKLFLERLPPRIKIEQISVDS